MNLAQLNPKCMDATLTYCAERGARVDAADYSVANGSDPTYNETACRRFYGPNMKKSKVSTVARGTATEFSGSDMPTSPNGRVVQV
jgi:hypothetical protein